LLTERGNQGRGVGDDDHLRPFGGIGDEARQRREQVWMQAGFGFVQNHQRGRPRR
jgi:hypothetical protein